MENKYVIQYSTKMITYFKTIAIQSLLKCKAEKKKLINISDRGDFSIEDAPEYFEESCSAIQNITDFFRFGKQVNQIKRLSIPDMNDQNIYEEIQDEVSALDDPLENSEWLDLYEGNVENNLINGLVKAKTNLETKT